MFALGSIQTGFTLTRAFIIRQSSKPTARGSVRAETRVYSTRFHGPLPFAFLLSPFAFMMRLSETASKDFFDAYLRCERADF
jgi:hypothetical protein